MSSDQLATFAASHNLGPDAALTLPAIFTRLAQEADMPRERLQSKLLANPQAAAHIATLARKIASTSEGQAVYRDWLMSQERGRS